MGNDADERVDGNSFRIYFHRINGDINSTNSFVVRALYALAMSAERYSMACFSLSEIATPINILSISARCLWQIGLVSFWFISVVKKHEIHWTTPSSSKRPRNWS